MMTATSLRSENLAEVYELALKNDPLLKAAEATYRAGKENKAQGIAGLLPSLTVSGTTTWNEYRVEEQLIDQYNSNAYLANLNQPIFRLDKWFQFERGNALSEAAAAEFAYQQQETMIRVASAYFNVLNSIDSLNAARAEEKAIGRQKDLAKKRFDVGLAAITEVQETQAAYDLTVVSRIARESQLDTAQETLTSIVGRDIKLLSPLKDDFIIAFDMNGDQICSKKFSDLIFNNQESDKRITFVIGGSFGLSSEIKDNSNKVLSASLFTFPHRLFRLILVEQIYRAHTIVNNMPYHK